jgi:hypothetical protein
MAIINDHSLPTIHYDFYPISLRPIPIPFQQFKFILDFIQAVLEPSAPVPEANIRRLPAIVLT